MAESSIKVQLPAFTLSHSDASIEIRSDGKKLGTACLSKGGIDWYTPKAKYPTATISWPEFVEMLNKYKN